MITELTGLRSGWPFSFFERFPFFLCAFDRRVSRSEGICDDPRGFASSSFLIGMPEAHVQYSDPVEA